MADWKPFDYRAPPEGALWLEVERPGTWCDAADDGRTIGGFDGTTHRVVVLAQVYRDDDGPAFEAIPQADCGMVEAHDTVRRYLPLTPPPAPNA